MEFELISDLFSACLGSCGDAFEHFGKDSPEEEKDTDRVIAMLDKLGQKPGSELEDLFMDKTWTIISESAPSAGHI